MSVPLLAQRQMSAEKNANTGSHENESAVSPSQSPVEAISAVVHSATGALDSILGGGSHPENEIPTAVDTALATAGGKPGRLGGQVPNFTHVADAAGAATKQTGQDVVAIGKDVWGRIRKVVG